jgi:putative transposase
VPLLASSFVSRRPRSALPDGVYHVTAHAIWGLSLFQDDEDRRSFLWLLGESTSRCDVRCLAYCLMNTHVHLLLEGTSTDLGAAMQRLNGRYAQRFNTRHNRSGHIFGQRYSAHVLRDERHLEEARAYIAANPVKAGLCDSEADWRWTWVEGHSRDDDRAGKVPVPAVRADRPPERTLRDRPPVCP